MHIKLIWNDVDDDRLKQLRGDGCSWQTIADKLRISPNAAMDRGRSLGAQPRSKEKAARAERRRELGEAGMRPGHPVSWGALTAGTVLEGEPYPPQPPLGSDWPEHFIC